MIAKRNMETGFTLTEVMIVVAIVGALSAIAIPNFLDWNRKAKLRDGVALLHGNMALARMNAINQNTNVTITLTQAAATNPVSVTFVATSGASVLPALTLDQEISLTNISNAAPSSPQDVQFNSMGLKSNTGSANNLCITSSGAATACTGSTTQVFNFKNTKGLNYRIAVSSTGKASWCYTNDCRQ